MNWTVSDAVRVMREFAPEEWAEEWDNVGLQFGRADAPIRRIATCLDATEEIIAQAVDWGAELIVAHHPVLFRPPRTLREDRPDGRWIAAFIRSGIAFYAAHTNADVAPGGTNDALADALGLLETRPLVPGPAPAMLKFVTFAPPDAISALLDAASSAGGGTIGNYSRCSFRSSGAGTYLPMEGSHPRIGEPGRFEETPEERLEILVPERRIGAVLEAVRAVHPYDEMAYDLYPLRSSETPVGLGRIGRLAAPLALDEFAEKAKIALDAGYIDAVRGVEPIETVAVCGGSCGKYIQNAFDAGAQAFVTSEIGHHQKLLARSLGLSLLEASHAATENPVVRRFSEILLNGLPGTETKEFY